MFQGGVDSTDEDAIDLLMGKVTPGADNLVGAKKPVEDSDSGDDEPEVVTSKVKGKSQEENNEDLFEKVSKKSDEEVNDALFGEGNSEDDEDLEEDVNKKDKAPKVSKKAESKKTLPENMEVDYKAIYEAMVSDGIWGEVDVPEDAEWNADLYREIQALQVNSRVDDLLDKTGPYGKAIVEYEKNGGNPAEIINLFREERTVRDFDISDPEGQEEFLTSYYEAQNYSPKSIDRIVKALIDQGGDALKEEAEEKKQLWESDYQEEIKRVQQQQAYQAQQMQEQVRNFNRTINETLTSDPELTPKERKELNSYMLNYTQNVRGQDVSQFYVDMAQIQNDPASYVELAKFIKGLKDGSYKKRIASKTQKEVAAKTFLKVKGGNALSKRDGGSPELNGEEETSSFISYLKRK